MADLRQAALRELARRELERRQSGPGAGESLGRGALQGATLGFADEIAGGAEAAWDVATTDAALSDLPARYRQHRGESRDAFSRAQKANPTEYGVGEVGGAIASALVPGLGAAKGLGGALKAGAVIGGAAGLGDSEADLTEGAYGEALADTAMGAGAGMVGGAVGHGLAKGAGAVVRKVAGRAQRGVQSAIDEETARQAANVDKAIASAQGEYRSSVQSASRDLEVLAREAAELPPGPARTAARKLLASKEGLAVRESVVGGKLGTAPQRIGEMGEKLGAYQGMAAGREGAIAARTAGALADPLHKQVLPRVATLGHRLIPAALAGAGGMVGGPEGAAVGTGLGAVMALTSGRPGIIVRNLVRSPAARKWLWELVLKAISPATMQTGRAVSANPLALGKFGRAIGRALSDGGEAQAYALHMALLEASPEYGEELAAAAQSGAAAQ